MTLPPNQVPVKQWGILRIFEVESQINIFFLPRQTSVLFILKKILFNRNNIYFSSLPFRPSSFPSFTSPSPLLLYCLFLSLHDELYFGYRSTVLLRSHHQVFSNPDLEKKILFLQILSPICILWWSLLYHWVFSNSVALYPSHTSFDIRRYKRFSRRHWYEARVNPIFFQDFAAQIIRLSSLSVLRGKTNTDAVFHFLILPSGNLKTMSSVEELDKLLVLVRENF